MVIKFYEKLKEIIKKNYLYILFFFILYTILLYPLPYYIYSGGGIINVDERVGIDDQYKSDGSFNLCYVTEIKATIPTYLLAKILPNWDIVAKEDVSLSSNETDKDIYTRDRVFLNNANVNAITVAYKRANKEITITNTNNYIIYIAETAKTNLKIGDIIKKVDGNEIDSLDDLKEIVNNKSIGEIIDFVVIRNNKEKKCTAEVIEDNGTKIVGISLQTTYEYETNPVIDLNFSSNESGPSGGLLLALSIYNHLINDDITNGMKIAGTGTIDIDGNVGSIGGVKYKLSGAVSSKADIFIVPNGENYEEAMTLKKKHSYDIKIIGVSTFDEAIKKLEEMGK